ncbi:helix-turn-helix domain-containing protein [Niabella drilacis]|uniref:AraC-type DNA-binding protein n=1 Tax=Niabella drilacis (strain DSM 25811 / CCM 8410 / CCUG 62505 / LMG 26954 / E90) TaxID=1285928 RepID=A0A1G6RCK7_NIADE|nr:helix-turn-helix transcriptional regulator [Niabella drilacis]SDD01646.1 AraC-type DNA-binding protein [Niabella drilacis]
MELPESIRFATIISDPEVYINSMLQLHPDAKHDRSSGAIAIKNEIIDSSFKYRLLEEGLFLFSFTSYSPVDAEYGLIPNPASDYCTLVFYFTEKRTKNPLYLKVDEQFYSGNQFAAFFNGQMNAEIFIKAKQQAFGIQLEIHKKWFAENSDLASLLKRPLFADILNFREKAFVQAEAEQYQQQVENICSVFDKEKDVFQKLKLKAGVHKLIYLFLEEICGIQRHKKSTPAGDPGELEFALNYMEKSYGADFPGTGFLAAQCKMSESSFNKKFKTIFRLTAAQHFRNLKMKEALRLLELGYNVKDVCYKIGYQDTSAFGRSFKQVYGKSPASYVKK